MFRILLGCGRWSLGLCGMLAMPWVWSASHTHNNPPDRAGHPLQQLFEMAWARQPEARALALRQGAAEARRESADSWTSSPAALELSTKGDQLYGKGGTREHIAGVALPLWLSGEQERTGHLADAERQAVQSRMLAAQLRTAASVREVYWQWQRAQVARNLAQERVHNVQQFTADVARRVKAGDQAQVDLVQAESAQAQAEWEVVAAESQLAIVAQSIRALTGQTPPTGILTEWTAEPLPADWLIQESRHPTLRALSDQAEVARHTAALANIQTRANPELTLSTTHERGGSGSSYQDSLTVGIRIPLGSDSRNRTKQALAQADALEAETQLDLSRQRAETELEAARQRLDATRAQQRLAEQRAQRAEETRRLFIRSFQLGQTDFPNRLRVERDAIDARQQAALAQVEVAAATSLLRQALGLLPE